MFQLSQCLRISHMLYLTPNNSNQLNCVNTLLNPIDILSQYLKSTLKQTLCSQSIVVLYVSSVLCTHLLFSDIRYTPNTHRMLCFGAPNSAPLQQTSSRTSNANTNNNNLSPLNQRGKAKANTLRRVVWHRLWRRQRTFGAQKQAMKKTSVKTLTTSGVCDKARFFTKFEEYKRTQKFLKK